MRTSRTMPPPMAVIIPRVTTPTMSTRTDLIAVSAPFRAKTSVPARSRTSTTTLAVVTAAPPRFPHSPWGRGYAGRHRARRMPAGRRLVASTSNDVGPVLRRADAHGAALSDSSALTQAARDKGTLMKPRLKTPERSNPQRIKRELVAGVAAVSLGLVVVPVGAASGAATTLYVRTTGCSDTGTGTATLPYCTIVKAAKVAVAGQTVVVSAGTYTGEVAP